ncbi:MAG TPA: ABC transporter permease [Acidimicrobiales bacterium]|nr:ABC transporter permease [Acidimicrobiales bacterium]
MSDGLRLLVGNELRRRWRALLMVALLAALVTGAVLTCAAGARRAHRAPARYLAAAAEPDAFVLGLPADTGAADLARLPGVRGAATYTLLATQPHGVGASDFFPLFAPDGPGAGRPFFTEPVVHGRRPDPARADEIALGEATARRLHLGVGDRLRLDTWSAAAAARLQDAGDVAPDGPPLSLRVVGILRQATDLGGREGDVAITPLTPAVLERHRGSIGLLDRVALVRLAPGASERFAAGLRDLAPGASVDGSFGASQIEAALRPPSDVVSTGLWALAAAMAVSGLVAVGLALARAAAAAQGDDAALRALAVRRADRIGRIAVPGALFAAGGVVAGAAASVLASPTMPVGQARLADPRHGVVADPFVLAAGAALGAVGVAALAVFAAVQATRSRRPAPVRPSALESRLTGVPPAVTAGLLLARRRGGREVTPARAAAAASVAAVVGVLAAVVFAASSSQLLVQPRLYGWGWDAAITGTETSDLDDGAVDPERVRGDADLAAAALISEGVGLTAGGRPTTGLVVTPLKGDSRLVLLAGRQLASADDALFGSATLRAAGARVGDTVSIGLGESTAPFHVVGEAVFPVRSDGGSSSEGVALSGDGARRLGFAGCGPDDECSDNVALTLRPRASLARVSARYADPGNRVGVRAPAPPAQAERLRQVRLVPWLLAGFLVVVAVLSLGHAVATAVRRRRHELAVLRCLGFTARQLRTVVSTQALALVLGSCTIGVLLGVVAGRAVWALVTGAIDLPPVASIPAVALLGIPLAVLALAQVAAVPPRRAAARLDPAEVLRRD